MVEQEALKKKEGERNQAIRELGAHLHCNHGDLTPLWTERMAHKEQERSAAQYRLAAGGVKE